MDVKFQRKLIDLSLAEVERSRDDSMKQIFQAQAERLKQELRDFLKTQKQPKSKKGKR